MKREALTPTLHLCVDPPHTFGIDAFLLADFAAPRPTDRICDLCTGCGILPLLWHRAPDCAPRAVTAVDLQPEAIALLCQTLAENALAGISPVQADLRTLTGRGWAGVYDLVTCNPPYVPTGQGRPATQAGRQTNRTESATLDELSAAAARLLRFGGRFCLCHRPARLVDVIAALRAAKLEPKRLRFVAQSATDTPWLFLMEARLGGKPSLTVEPLIQMESPEATRLFHYE